MGLTVNLVGDQGSMDFVGKNCMCAGAWVIVWNERKDKH